MLRKRSIADLYSTVEVKIRDMMNEFSILWDQVDMSESMRLNRMESAFTHITLLCDDMLGGEMDMVQNLNISIRNDMRSVKKMRSELEMNEYEQPIDLKNGSIGLRRHLRAEVEKLEIEYRRRHEDQKSFIEKFQNLKKRLDLDFEFEYNTRLLFPSVVLNEYSRIFIETEELISYRYTHIKELQTDMRQWRNVAWNVSKYIERDKNLSELLEKDIDSDDFVFSEQVHDNFKASHTDAKVLYTVWLEEMKIRWAEKYQQIENLWEKCMIPVSERSYSPVFDPDKDSEKHLKQMIEECELLESKHYSCGIVYDLVQKWKNVWSEKLKVDEKRKQPDYYKKVNVLPDNRRERVLLAQMHILEREIGLAYENFRKRNEKEHILIEGMKPIEYIMNLQEKHKRKLKSELQLRKEEKYRLQSPATPRTPSSLKKTIFRMPWTEKAKAAAKNLNSDVNHPPCLLPAATVISFITPKRKRSAGPKASSPNDKQNTPLSKRKIV